MCKSENHRRLHRSYLILLARPLSLSLVFLLALLSPNALIAQSTSATPPQGMGGVSTGTAATYSTRRTVDIVDQKAPVIFEDVTQLSGLGRFLHRSGSVAKDYI